MEEWYLLNSGLGEPYYNMALDEALMMDAPRQAHPILRFYGWTEPAATFGLLQRYDEVALWTPLRPLVRRPTGGGLVPHEADWTYSLIFPPLHPWYALPATLSYQRLHEWLRLALSAMGIQTELAPVRHPDAPGQCFAAGAEQHDLLWNGRKLAGAAQRRTRSGFLIQGSVQPIPSGWSRVNWERALCDAAVSRDNLIWQTWQPDPHLLSLARDLTLTKYSQFEYNQRR